MQAILVMAAGSSLLLSRERHVRAAGVLLMAAGAFGYKEQRDWSDVLSAVGLFLIIALLVAWFRR